MTPANFGAVRRLLHGAAVLALLASPASSQVVEKGRTFADLTATHPCSSAYTDRIARVTDCDAADDIGNGGGAFQCWATCDGSAPWATLEIGGGGAGVSDGDKGDITVASSGAAWTVDADAIALGTDTTGGYASSATEGGEANAIAPAVVIEGATADGFEGNFAFTDPTADWTWTWSGTGAVSGVTGITGGTSGSSTLVLDGDSTVTGNTTIDGAGKYTPTGGIDLRTSQATALNVIFRAGSSGNGYFYLGNALITGYDSPVVVDGNASLQIMGTGGVLFEGTTDDTAETKLTVTDPTADRTITLPNATGTVGTFVAAPAAATDACVAGQYAVATGFAYFCVSANTWERVPIATW